MQGMNIKKMTSMLNGNVLVKIPFCGYSKVLCRQWHVGKINYTFIPFYCPLA